MKKFSLAQLKWLNFYFGMTYLVQYADKFIVLSDFIKNYLISKNIREENILILPNITDPEIFNVQNVKEHIKGKITIGYSGTPTRKDGVVYLIESFAVLTKKYPDTHLLIIGDVINGNSIIPGLKENAANLGIADKVTFTGLVPFKDVPRQLNSCQILALTRPSGVFAEAGFPTKLGEYFACRKPILVTSVGDINKYFVNGVHAVIVKPEDIDSIVDGFESLILNEHLRQQIAINAYNWLQENLNYRTLSAKINNFTA
jgi:glycosyltransferase involved in cell wall biosynthesis